MDIPEKLTFIHDLVDSVKSDIIKKVNEMPEDWDGMELRWYIKEKFSGVVDPAAKHQYKKRYREYRYFVFGKGL